MPNPVWYRSLYWRIALGFILCIAGVLAAQGVVLLWLLDRADASTAQLSGLTHVISSDLSAALAVDPELDVDRYTKERYQQPAQSFFVVMANGQVACRGPRRPPDSVVRYALDGLKQPGRASIPDGWETGRYQAAAILVNGRLVGAVGLVPETWMEQLGSTMAVVGGGLLLAGTVVASLFIVGPVRRRLRDLESAAQRIGSGDLGARARADGGDEVAALAHAFNRMAADLGARAEQVAASDRTRRMLLADVSHELMTPLTAVLGYQEKLAMDPLICESEIRSRYLSIIGEETQRVEHIVGDLLDLARLEGGADSLNLQDVSVEGLFGRVAARHEREAAANRLELSTSIAPGAEIVFGDRLRLEQALQNLAANAVRHTPVGGRIELDAELRGNEIILSVRDTGAGIPPEHLPFVFDRFYKVDPSRAGGAVGSGLGLSIVKATIERHGGTVSVSSEPNVGSTFAIHLPAGIPVALPPAEALS
jgi:signal transduction histidine kinase